MLVYNGSEWDFVIWDCSTRAAIVQTHHIDGLMLYQNISRKHPTRFCCVIPKILGLFGNPTQWFKPQSSVYDHTMFEGAERFNTHVQHLKNQAN